MSDGRGGHWNRAGRRSGGPRPTRIDIPALRDGEELMLCPRCGNDALPLVCTRDCRICFLVHRLTLAMRVRAVDRAQHILDELAKEPEFAPTAPKAGADGEGDTA